MSVYKADGLYMTYSGDWSVVDFPCRCGINYADKVFIITSGENMAIHAAANIAMAEVDKILKPWICGTLDSF